MVSRVELPLNKTAKSAAEREEKVGSIFKTSLDKAEKNLTIS